MRRWKSSGKPGLTESRQQMMSWSLETRLVESGGHWVPPENQERQKHLTAWTERVQRVVVERK